MKWYSIGNPNASSRKDTSRALHEVNYLFVTFSRVKGLFFYFGISVFLMDIQRINLLFNFYHLLNLKNLLFASEREIWLNKDGEVEATT